MFILLNIIIYITVNILITKFLTSKFYIYCYKYNYSKKFNNMINVNKKITKYENESSEGMASLLSYIVK